MAKLEIEEVWECAAGHSYESPLGIKCEAVVCPRCVQPYLGAHDERAGITKWNMKKVRVRSRNGRLVKA